MKILQLCYRVPFPPKDGGTLAMHSIWEGLTGQGHTVKILALNTSKHYVRREELPESYLLQSALKTTDINTDLSFAAFLSSFFRMGSYNVDRFYSEEFSDLILKTLSQESFDIIQMESIFLGPYVKKIRSHFSGKIILRAHNVEHKIWQQKAKNEKSLLKTLALTFLRKRLRTKELEYLKNFDAIIAITEEDKLQFQKEGYKRNVFVHPFTLDPQEYSPAPASQNASLFFIGSLDWAPNTEGLNWFISKVWPLLKASCPDLVFNIAGRNAASFREKTKDDKIKILGEVPSAKDFMRNNGIFIVPLLSGGGMRVKIIEGMALEKAIVCTPLGAEGISYKADEHLFIRSTPEGFAEGIITLLHQTEKVKKLGQNARMLVEENYNTKKALPALVGFYEKLKTN